VPVRLVGLWSATDADFPTDAVLTQVLEAFPAEAQWTRSVRRARFGAIAIDRCGGSADPDAFAEGPDGCVGVAGTIRLDGRGRLRQALGDVGGAGSDASLVAAAYQRWGIEALKRLTGDFAFALWDLSGHPTLYLCRDPFGVRRLHFASRGGRVTFSTEIEGVLAWRETDRGLDDVTILDNLLGRYQTRTRTFFRSIRRVCPGHFMRFRSEEQREIRYAMPPDPSVRLGSLAEYAELFRHELDQAVGDRLPSSGAVVCHLSGGLDSASLACLAAKRLERDGRADDLALVNARFVGLPCDEGRVAAQIAAFTNLSLHEWNGLRPEVSDLDKPRLAWPLDRSSIGGSWQGDLDLAQGRGASILMSGQGGNQLTDEWNYLADVWREDGILGCFRTVSGALKGRSWGWRRNYIRRLVRQARSAFVPPETNRRRALRSDPLFQPPPSWAGSRLRQAWSELREETEQRLPRHPITGSWMRDSIWQAATEDPTNIWAMEHEDARATERGMEFRYPFLSWSLLELVMSVPWRLKAPRSHGRILHREAMKGVIPEDVRLLDAFVFFNDANMSNCQSARPIIEALLGRPGGLAAELVDPAAIGQILRSVSGESGKRSSFDAGEAWRLLRDTAALEAWLGLFSC
jgi:asparagine synthase (glutamine-hydrolysing)